MIFILTKKNNIDGIYSIEVSKYFNIYFNIIEEKNFIYKLKKNEFKEKDLFLFLDDDEYFSTVQLDKFCDLHIKKIANYDVIVAPQIFCKLPKNYVITNTNNNFFEKILFNQTHSLFYSFNFLNKLISKYGIDSILNLLKYPILIKNNFINSSNIKVIKELDFLIVSNKNIEKKDFVDKCFSDSKDEIGYKNLLDFINNSYYGMEQDV